MIPGIGKFTQPQCLWPAVWRFSAAFSYRFWQVFCWFGYSLLFLPKATC